MKVKYLRDKGLHPYCTAGYLVWIVNMFPISKLYTFPYESEITVPIVIKYKKK